jgi:hypothetical protein
MDEQPLGDLLSKALDRQERIREAVDATQLRGAKPDRARQARHG